jgi:tetratricopeptide (TPR) repeat protein
MAAVVLVAVVSTAAAETVAETARAMVLRYDVDPVRIDRARDLVEGALARERQVPAMVAASYLHFLYGEVRARDDGAKLAAYDRGREWGRRAVELAPRDEEAHVWYAINTGRWGQTKGLMRSLFLLPTVREEIDIILGLNPRSVRGHALAGNVLFEVPALLGGDRARAEEHYRKGIEIDPRFTVLRVDLARLLIAQGRLDEARRELRRVLDETAPTSQADWNARDVPRARALLDSLKDRK